MAPASATLTWPSRLAIASPAEIFFKRSAERDYYFHVYKQSEYQPWPHKNRLALLYTHQAPIPDMEQLLASPEGAGDGSQESPVEALVFVQALNCAFRWAVRMRHCIVAANECFEMSREFAGAEAIESELFRAITNCHQLHFIYPPFSMQSQLQMRQQLLHHIEPFSRGLMRKFKELVNKMQRVEIAGPASSPFRPLDEPEASRIAPNLAEGKPGEQHPGKRASSMLGKVFGRIRSPLARKLDDIPE